MTTDAKIGLLLALVFIVAITFVINGLPDFLNKKDKTDLTSNYISHYNRPDEPGIVDRSSREAAALLNRKMISSTPAAASAEANNVQNNIQNTSYQTILPAASEVVKNTMTETAAVNATTETMAAAPAAATPAAVQTADAVKTADVVKSSDTVYQVSDGDSLAFIAQKFYGPNAGNKYANIQKIYEANKKTMKSIDELQVGQKLVIPPLSEKEKSLVKTGLFEKVKDDVKTEKATAAVKTSATTKAATTKAAAAAKAALEAKETKKFREYVVKESDTLWKIAAKYLGDGGRFKEIADLNKSMNPDNLVAGTKIKIPVK